MNVIELKHKLEADTLVIDTNGHNIHMEKIKYYLKSKVKFVKRLAEEDTTDLWTQRIYRVPTKIGRPFTFGIGADIECPVCGESLNFYPREDGSIYLGKRFHYGFGPARTPEENVCPFPNGIQPHTENIEVTDTLVFVNHFKNDVLDAPEDKEYDHEYSLNTYQGMINITKHLASQDVGFGQVGNTTIEIYVSKYKKNIKIFEGIELFLENYDYDTREGNDITQEEKNTYTDIQELLKNYDCMGEICLDVWRWMCASQDVIKERNLPTEEDDTVRCDVEKGTWAVTHYHDTKYKKCGGVLISELNLV